MFHLLDNPALAQLTLALMYFIWQGTLIAALVALAWRCLPGLDARRRYAIALAGLCLMGLAPIVTHVFLIPSESGATLLAQASVDSSFRAMSPVLRSEPSAQFLPAWQPYMLAAWLVGVVCLSFRLVTGYLGTLWLRRARIAVPFGLAVRVTALGRRMAIDASRRVFGSARVTEAVAVGFWRPIVLVPLAWLAELPPHVLEAVIAHELAHIRRWDLWATLVQRVIETLLFYHPAVWWLSRRVSLEREMCCDELAVAATGRPAAYARVLECLGRRSVTGVSLVLATSFKGEADMNLLMRIRQVLGLQPQPESGRGWIAGAAAVAVALGALIVVAGSGNRQAVADEREKPAAREGERDGARREGGERETGARRPAEGEGVRRPAEGDAPRRPAAEGDRRATAAGADIKPETDREERLMQLIKQLQQQNAELRDQIVALQRGRDGSRPVARDGDAPTRREGARDGDKPRTGVRDGDQPKTGPRDGDAPRREGARDGDKPKTGARDGDAPRREGARDGDRPKEGARDGDAPRREGARDGGDKPRAKDGE